MNAVLEVQEITEFSAQSGYDAFRTEFDEAAFIDLPISDEGDRVNQDAPSVVVDGTVVRKKDGYMTRQIAVDMVIRDGERSKSLADLERLFIIPAAKWLKEQIGELITVPQASTPPQEGVACINRRELRMIMHYDSIKKGTVIVFTVLVLDLIKD